MMNIGSQKMQNAAPSDCRIFCSSQNPSGQFRKVSIGITVDKCSKEMPILRKANAVSLAAGGRTFSCQHPEEGTKAGIVGNLERNRLEAVENHKESAWFSTRPEKSTRVETSTAETCLFFVNRVPILQSEHCVHTKSDTVCGRGRENGGNEKKADEVAFATMLETQLVDKGNAREEPEKPAKFIFGTGIGEGGHIERTEEIAFSTKQLIGEENCKDNNNNGKHLSQNGKEPEKMAKCENETLKMKLWEILGTAPSENKNTVNSQNFSEHKVSLNINQSEENQKGKVTRGKQNSPNLDGDKEHLNINRSTFFQKRNTARAKQNSDPIETDSESPNRVMRRPVTRSSTRKKALQKLQDNASCGKKPLSPSGSDFKLKLEKKNIFAFDKLEEKAGSSGRTSSGHSNRYKEKMDSQNKAEVDPRRIYFPRSSPKKSSHNKDREQTMLAPERTLSPCKEKGNSFVPRQDKKQFLQAPDGTPLDDHHSLGAEYNFGSPLWAFKREIRENTESPLLKKKRYSWGHEESPSESKNAFLNDDVTCRSIGREADQLDDFCSPMFAMDVSPTSPRMPQNEVLSSSPADQPSLSLEKGYNSGDLDNSTPGSTEPDADTESSDDNREIHEQTYVESPCMKTEKPQKQLFSASPMVEQDTESKADDLTNQDFGLTDKWFDSTESLKKSPLFYHHTKRVRSLNNVKLSNANLFSPSPIGTSRTEETFGSLESLEQYPEGSLTRCVAHLALVLNKFKRRMRSQTSKRSSEILSAVADKICQQLLDVESQIQADLKKFNNIGKSKRMHLESKFQEKQGNIKLIHDKFKEEINQHLMDCRTILEELEAYNTALKGTADWQQASHRKLILKTKQAVVVQIDDAETRIAAIHKNARHKMTVLKHALKEWLD